MPDARFPIRTSGFQSVSGEMHRDRDHDRGSPRAEMRVRRDYGMHRGWHHGHDKKVVIIKRGHDRRY